MIRPRVFLCATFVWLSLAACEGNPPASAPQRSAPAAPAESAAPPKGNAHQRTPEEVVEEFGRRMKLVPTTASAEIAGAAIREQYAPLVHPHLLRAWIADPAAAPGRPVSSPWPERLEIESSSRSDGAVLVKAVLVEATSVVRDYYQAIDAKDFTRAYAMWGPSGPPGQSRDEFARGFEQTESVTVTTGQPSRVEAAAGSRYITVPVTITARTTSGARQRFAGTYILRRSVVDGATEAQRTWHLERASIRPVAGDDVN